MTEHSAPHASDSTIQQQAEAVVLARLSETLGVPLAPTRIGVDDAHVLVDGASADLGVLVEVSARQGPPRGGQPKKIATDALKLARLGTVLSGEHRLILAFADEAAARPFQSTTKGWLAAAIASHGIEIHVVDIGGDLRQQIAEAQVRQRR